MAETNGVSSDVGDDHVALAQYGRETIAAGSKSFAMASLLFGRAMQEDAHKLYAWCRHCDDVIDGQTLGGDAPDADLSPEDQATLLEELRAKTRVALEGQKVGHPAFDAFSTVAVRHKLPAQYAMDLLTGFEMDAARRQYRTLDDTLEYCYGVAGAVGLMMAVLMGVSPEDDETLDCACDLGLAFQLTNIARDVIDDADAGRIYMPASILSDHGIRSLEDVLAIENRKGLANATSVLLAEADRYYASASNGIRRLPPRAAAAVAAARNVYSDIGRVVIKRGAKAWDSRAHIGSARKTWLALCGLFQGAPQSVFLKNAEAPPRADLWRRPKDGLAFDAIAASGAPD